MKFNSYFARMRHSEPNFSGTLLIARESIPANFRKIGPDLFIVFFRNQVELGYLQEISFKNSQATLRILLPVLFKYNQRKLKKIRGTATRATDSPSFAEAVIQLLNIDRFIETDQLLDFFPRDDADVIPLLLRLEIDQKIKIISLHHLLVTSYEHYQETFAEMKAALTQSYESRIKSIRLADLEKKLKISHSTIFFKYLLRSFQDVLPIKVVRDVVILQKLPLSENEKELIVQVEKALKKNKLVVFTFADTAKFSGLNSGQVNDSLWYMQNEERIVQVDDRYFVFSEELNKIINRLKKYKRNQGEMIDFNALSGDDLIEPKVSDRLIRILRFSADHPAPGRQAENSGQRLGNRGRRGDSQPGPGGSHQFLIPLFLLILAGDVLGLYVEIEMFEGALGLGHAVGVASHFFIEDEGFGKVIHRVIDVLGFVVQDPQVESQFCRLLQLIGCL